MNWWSNVLAAFRTDRLDELHQHFAQRGGSGAYIWALLAAVVAVLVGAAVIGALRRSGRRR